MKNDYVFAKISQRDDMVPGIIVIFNIIFSLDARLKIIFRESREEKLNEQIDGKYGFRGSLIDSAEKPRNFESGSKSVYCSRNNEKKN